MKTHPSIGFACCMIWIFQSLSAQQLDINDTVNIPQVVVTANRNSRSVEDIPASVSIIDARTINSLPVQNVDEILRSVSNIYVNRSWGIFSQNASVTMRGLDASSRVLVLLDGVPLNKSAGGSVNWHLLSASSIERIEIIKGPASAIYGNNAMGGVINIITKNSEKPIQGEVGISGGTYQSLGGHINVSGMRLKNDKGFSWRLSSFYRQGDGYFLSPESQRDTTDARVFLKEYNIEAKAGYQFNKNHKFDVGIRVYDDLRGQGTKVYEEFGDYMSVNTTYLRASYKGNFNNSILNVLAFYQFEYEYKQSESISANSGKYKLSDRDSRKKDYGLWINASTHLAGRHILTYGLDLKRGSVNVANIYKTSTDELFYTGTLDFYGAFIQDELKLFNNKLVVVLGARMDFSAYYNGQLIVKNPTSNTGFSKDLNESFSHSQWNAFSPKLALKFHLNKVQSVYISYSKGFMPPKLDDLSKSGKIRKGFKLANPELGPEYISNYEVGYNLNFHGKIIVEPSIYYSRGRDFQYFVGTGDSIDTGGGDALQPVYQRQNISSVEILGVEISTKYQLLKSLALRLNYTYNHSIITDFAQPDKLEKDISGNYLMEVPMHMFYAGINWENHYFKTNLSFNYISSQWYDDENTTKIDAYNMIDFQVSKDFYTYFNASIIIQNILNEAYIDRKGYLSPGRFITAELIFKF